MQLKTVHVEPTLLETSLGVPEGEIQGETSLLEQCLQKGPALTFCTVGFQAQIHLKVFVSLLEQGRAKLLPGGLLIFPLGDCVLEALPLFSFA